MRDKTILTIQEGPIDNYYQALIPIFGGEVKDGGYSVSSHEIDLQMSSYIFPEEIELVVASGIYNKAIEIERSPDGDPDYIHIAIIKEGQLTRSYSNQKQFIEADTSMGVFAHNGMFPLVTEIPPNVNYKAVTFKFSKKSLERLLPETNDLIKQLFGNPEPITYHMHSTREIERLTDDIYYFRDETFGSRALVMARGLEVLTSLFLKAKQLLENNDIQGLHVDDYQRLLKIKNRLMSSFNQKISVEEIALEFGISISKLKRDFKTLFDCSLYQFYTHAKMDEAYRMLKSGEYTVMDVGYELGYQNLSKFSSMFKKVKGLSPKDVLKMPV